VYPVNEAVPLNSSGAVCANAIVGTTSAMATLTKDRARNENRMRELRKGPSGAAILQEHVSHAI
jgi:hypothetical protein